MIRKLRIKIVLVIVLVAAVMLGVIFGMSYTMTRQDLRAQSLSMMQAIAAGELSGLAQARQVVSASFALRRYEPSAERNAWEEAYGRLRSMQSDN